MGPVARPGLKSCFTVGKERGNDKGKETEYYYCTRTVDEKKPCSADFLPTEYLTRHNERASIFISLFVYSVCWLTPRLQLV